MASFPSAIKSFTTKNAGDVVQSAHINDLQDEVNAIEAGIINGTAPINSSRATPTALSVSGGSTLGTLQAGASTHTSMSVTGASTLATLQAGASTFTARPVMPPPDAVYVVRDSTYAVGSSNESTIAFVSQAYITNSSMHSTGSNPERLIPQSTGLYQITAHVATSSNSTGYRQVVIQDSSLTIVARRIEYAAGNSSDAGAVFGVTGYKRFDVTGSYVTFRFQQLGASTLSLLATDTWFAMHKL